MEKAIYCPAHRVRCAVGCALPCLEVEHRTVPAQHAGSPDQLTVAGVCAELAGLSDRERYSKDWWMARARSEPDTSFSVGLPSSAQPVREAMRYFECAVGHRWLEPYAQQGTGGQRADRACIVLDCVVPVAVRRIVSAVYA